MPCINTQPELLRQLIGIYQIQSKSKPDYIYIGSSVNINKRLNHHKNRLINNAHHSRILQNHVNKYGIDDLTFMPIAECEKNDLINIEQLFIDLAKPRFNIRPIAESNLGFKHSEETRRKIANSHKGITPSEETCRLLSEQRRGNKFNLGHKMTDAAKEKNRLAHIGRTWTEEHRRIHSERMRGENNPFYGKHHILK